MNQEIEKDVIDTEPKKALLQFIIENSHDTKQLLLGYPDDTNGLKRFKEKSLDF